MIEPLNEDAIKTYRPGEVVFPIPVLKKEETPQFRFVYERFCNQLAPRPRAAPSHNLHLFHRGAHHLRFASKRSGSFSA